MTAPRFLIAGVLVGITSAGAAAQSEEQLTIRNTFQGTVANDMKPQLTIDFIANETDWKKVWAKVNPNEELPAVDFTEHFLLIGTRDAADPNERTTIILKDDNGIVSLSGETTAIGFEPSDKTIYSFYKVARAGVLGVRRHMSVEGEYPVDRLPNRSRFPKWFR